MSAVQRKQLLAAKRIIPIYILETTASAILSRFYVPGLSVSQIIERILLERLAEADS